MDSFDALSNMLLDSEITVRVEMATVTLSVREWGEIRAGDVIETAVLLREPVVLRVGGREVARGELVNVDGRVGVRVSDVLEPG